MPNDGTPMSMRATRSGLAVLAGLLAIFLVCTDVAAADELPVLRKGQWAFKRTMSDPDGKGPERVVATERCVDPTEEMKRQNAMLTKSGCRLTPVNRRGDIYTFGSECSIQGLSVKGTSVLTADGDAAYTLDVDSIQDGKRVKEKMVARRLGDCR